MKPIKSDFWLWILDFISIICLLLLILFTVDIIIYWLLCAFGPSGIIIAFGLLLISGLGIAFANDQQRERNKL